MVFRPTQSQDDIRARANAIEEGRLRHEAYVKKTDVRIKVLENENAARKNEGSFLLDAHKAMGKEISMIKDAFDILKKWADSSNHRFALLEQRLDGAINVKLDLAEKINKAKKRLDRTQKT